MTEKLHLNCLNPQVLTEALTDHCSGNTKYYSYLLLQNLVLINCGQDLLKSMLKFKL